MQNTKRMNQLNESLMKVKSEELLSGFRSKEDLYRYMTQQMGLYFPSYQGTKLSFIRSLLSNEKKALKQQEVIMTSAPKYEELSVKNLYEDAMKDEILKDYLPDLWMNSDRYPERNFFFGILGTIKHECLKQIIADANMKRYNNVEAQGEENFIAIQDVVLRINEHPFISNQSIGKPRKAIFLIKQSSKLMRNKKIYHKYDLSQRLSNSFQEEIEMLDKYEQTQKRQKRKQSQQTTIIQNEDNMSQQHYNI